MALSPIQHGKGKESFKGFQPYSVQQRKVSNFGNELGKGGTILWLSALPDTAVIVTQDTLGKRCGKVRLSVVLAGISFTVCFPSIISSSYNCSFDLYVSCSDSSLVLACCR